MHTLHKKILLGTSALISTAIMATAAQAKIDVTTGGFVRFEVGFFDDDHKNTTDRDAQMESEIHIRAKNTTEAGLEYGAIVQLKASTSDTVAADEVTLWVETKWGRIELGDQDGAADTMAYYAPKVGFGQAVDSEFKDYVDPSSRPQIGPKALDSADDTKITYYTPRFMGLQVGASYAPELDNGENILRESRSDMTLLPAPAVNANGNTSGNNGNLLDYVMPATSSNNGDFVNSSRGNAHSFFKKSFEDFVEIGANYVNKFDDISVAIAGGYTHAEQKSVSTYELDRHPINAYHIGAQLGWMGWKIGGSYVDNHKSGQLKNDDPVDNFQTEDRNAWNIGLSYETGPWGVGVNYISEDLGGSINGSGEYHAFGFGGVYKLAPGMSIAADAVSFKRKFGRSGTPTPITPTQPAGISTLKQGKVEDSGYVFVIGSRLDF
jgi:outer membrane protein OmpU